MKYLFFFLSYLLICFSGLNNNTELETFNLRHTLDDCSMIPMRYIKLEPLESWGSNFNFSLWYVELVGIEEPNIVADELTKFYQVN